MCRARVVWTWRVWWWYVPTCSPMDSLMRVGRQMLLKPCGPADDCIIDGFALTAAPRCLLGSDRHWQPHCTSCPHERAGWGGCRLAVTIGAGAPLGVHAKMLVFVVHIGCLGSVWCYASAHVDWARTEAKAYLPAGRHLLRDWHCILGTTERWIGGGLLGQSVRRLWRNILRRRPHGKTHIGRGL